MHDKLIAKTWIRSVVPGLFIACIAPHGSALASGRAAPGSVGPSAPAGQAPLERQLLDTAAVVEGEVTDISFTFDDWFGPRTVVRLEKVVSHLGAFPDATVTLRLAGGPLPNGHRMALTHMPEFRYATRYLVMLRRGPWRVDPTVSALAVVPTGELEFLASTSGSAIAAFDDVSGFRRDVSLPLFTTAREKAHRFDPPVRSAILNTMGEQLASKIPTKILVLQGLQVAAQKYKVSFGAFNPTPSQDTPWNIVKAQPAKGEGE